MEIEDDPWAPLPPETVAPPAEKRPAAPTSGARALSPERLRRPSAAPTAEAERLLQQMQQRLQTAKPASDPLRRALVKAAKRPLAVAPAAPAPPPEAPAPIGAIDYESDRDEREDEPWFRELPAEEQQRLRRRWDQERHRFDDRGQVARRRLWRATWHGALLFFVLSLLQAPLMGLGLVLPMTLAGALAAAGARACGGGRFVFGIAGTIAFFVVCGPMLLFSPFGMISLLACAFCMSALGLDAEMRRSGGFGRHD